MGLRQWWREFSRELEIEQRKRFNERVQVEVRKLRAEIQQQQRIDNLYREAEQRLSSDPEYVALRDSDRVFDRNRAALMLEVEIDRAHPFRPSAPGTDN